MKKFEYTSTAGFNAIVPATLHKLIQRGGEVGAVNGGKLNKSCKFKQVGDEVNNPTNGVAVAKPAAVKPVKAKAAPAPKAKPAAKAKPVPKKAVAKAKPAAKKGAVAKVSKYGTHPDGTIQFVPARGIYHVYVGGKIAAVKRDMAKAVAELTARGIVAHTMVTFEG